ncbi:unnamed protein product [Gadus morhua 'NCC']
MAICRPIMLKDKLEKEWPIRYALHGSPDNTLGSSEAPVALKEPEAENESEAFPAVALVTTTCSAALYDLKKGDS